MAIIDFHSHLLPQIDDGSKSLETTKEMLRRMSKQGVTHVIATPHFYATRDRMERFLERREEAYQKVLDMQQSMEATPKIITGSEVAFFRGISQAEQIDNLLIGDTNVMLLEMPFEEWSSSYIDEVESLIRDRGFRVVLAHLERYMDIKANKKKIQELTGLPVFVQINAESLLEWRKRGKLIKMFKNGEAHLLGSDCHGINHRVPNLGDGREVLRKKAGSVVLSDIDDLGKKLVLEGE